MPGIFATSDRWTFRVSSSFALRRDRKISPTKRADRSFAPSRRCLTHASRRASIQGRFRSSQRTNSDGTAQGDRSACTNLCDTIFGQPANPRFFNSDSRLDLCVATARFRLRGYGIGETKGHRGWHRVNRPTSLRLVHFAVATALANSPANFIFDFAIVLCVAAVTGLASRLLGQPSLLGYLLAGVVIGPYTPIPLFADVQRVHAMSEFGVVLVMFSVGLEFSFARFIRVVPRSGLLALVEISAMAWAGYVLGQSLGWTAIESLFLGGALSISSTMVVAKVFEDSPPQENVRELVLGALVIQDIVAIALLAIFTALAAGLSVSAEGLGRTIFDLALFLALLVGGGLVLVPRFVRFVESVGSPETRVVSAAGLCFGLALLAQSFGYSIALGAFVAGMLVAESGRGHAIDHLLTPARDLFVAVFFVSVGMSVDPLLVWDNLAATVLALIVVITGQFLAATLGGMLGGAGLRASVAAGLALGQIGEFAFIMAGIGTVAGVVGKQLLPVLVAVAIATSFTTPMLIRQSDRLASWLSAIVPSRLHAALSLYEAWIATLRERGPGDRSKLRRIAQVLIFDAAGLIAISIAGMLLHGRAMRAGDESFGLSPATTDIIYQSCIVAATLPFVFSIARAAGRFARLVGEQLLPLVDGNVPDFAAAPRRVLVVALQLGVIAIVGAPVLAISQPFSTGPWHALPIGLAFLFLLPVLWRDSGNFDGHLRAGAEVVVALLRQANTKPVTQTTSDKMQTISKSDSDAQLVADALPGLGYVEAVRIQATSPAIGRTLAQLHLLSESGLVVLAIAREQGDLHRPSGETEIMPGDLIVLMGARDAVKEACARTHEMVSSED